MAKARPVRVEVFDVYPATFGHCPHYNLLASEMAAAGAEFCELSSQVVEYPDEVIKSHRRVLDIANFLKREVGKVQTDISVEMVNLISPTGFIRGLRYGILGRFAILVNGKKVCDKDVNWTRLRDEVISACTTQKNLG